MDKEKEKISDDLLNRIRNELTAIMEENKSNDPKRRISYEDLMRPTPLPTLHTNKNEKKKKSSNKGQIYHNPQSHRSSVGGKTITMKPSVERLTAGQAQASEESLSSSSSSPIMGTSSASSLRNRLASLEDSLSAEFLESKSTKSIDEDMQKMQLELGQSYQLFQGIGEKFESINFGSLKSRIRDLRMNNMANDLGKVTTSELQKMFESSFLQNRLDKLTKNVGEDFRQHPGEFGDIPELSNFFQACTQLEHGLDKLKQQRQRTNELEQRLCWATEIAYDRMEEIRNSVGDKPETNF
ncbi:PREDICTED: uncharacterized protein LOC108617386 [Drosophila arizonae]|uniref:Uncharacterized protein LOC108617386 n=1 Tax=Drosophila arizonae TaxID=7263 RepID=A0ABM1PN82_DROAR|nr:PREDICTED: uncharacterized protein LOC108617386 [Drosophila arizonae]